MIEEICQQVYKKFPEVAGVRPILSERPQHQTLLIFNGTVIGANGHKIQRSVRVVTDSAGNVVKITTSR